MSDSYTKLFNSIVTSTIVGEPVATRWLWVVMIAQVKRDGIVYGSVPGLARIANLTIAETEAALACFMAPDPYSRTKDHEGRRIQEVDGGWRLLTHAKYQAIRDEADRAEYKRQWERDNRPTRKRNPTKNPTNPDNPTDSDNPDRADHTSSRSRSRSRSRAIAKAVDQEHVGSGDPTTASFAAFWDAYPVKEGKKDAQKVWKAKGLDPIGASIVADVGTRKARHRRWLEGYIPGPAVYLRGERWNDEIDRTPPTSKGTVTLAGQKFPLSKSGAGFLALKEMRDEYQDRADRESATSVVRGGGNATDPAPDHPRLRGPAGK